MNGSKLIITIIAASLIVFAGSFVAPSPIVNVQVPSLGAAVGPEHTERQFFKDGFTIGTSTSQTALTNFNCATTTYTIPALSPSFSQIGANFATTTITVTGARLGDHVGISNNSSTNALLVKGVFATAEVSSGNTVGVLFSNGTNVTSTAVTTSTIEACVSAP